MPTISALPMLDEMLAHAAILEIKTAPNRT